MPQLTMPNIGEGVAEGTVTRWLKQEGDDVALDEPVVEVETDKAVVEIPSPYAGTLSKIIVPEGGLVPIGAALAEFSDAEATGAAAVAATVEALVSTEAGRPSQQARATSGGGAAGPQRAAASNGTAVPPELRRTRQYSPVVLKLAAEHQLDLTLVRGTGIEGRITRQDVMRYLENPALHTVAPSSSEGVVGAEKRNPPGAAIADGGQPSPAVEARAASVGQPSPAVGADEIVALSPTRRTIAARMLESHQSIPAAWMAVEADVTGLVALRARAKEEFARSEGVRLTYMPFFVQAIVGALKQHPAINATFNDGAIIVHAHQHIGVAVATEHGLVVPVIRDAGDKSIAGLARELDALAAKARDRKLTVEEMRGATMTVDNTGAFGSVLSQPIIPVGQAAIVTTEAIRRELRPIGDAFGVRSVMNLCISIDHRALDGVQAGAFMADVKRRLEAYEPGQAVY